ncbi:hybrid sensor histidine kinase/response regulator [Stutzerimonas nosocomialis]|uniref:histidine kinase famiy protein n=1 Tax=Stutzerimonas nosocomialis TaxID=1056496 RepID=UPI001107F64A|nr:histidine kinase famiy protein [Stutzerimonas nosocomialis]TLX56628.1 hybrid sensor histidine kinase/response regulator [Stutzerimonas nosocomialis]
MTQDSRYPGDEDKRPVDLEGGGQSGGLPANGELEGNSQDPLGDNPGLRHWQASYITRPGLDDRSSVFFAAVEMTRMPMVITDPRQHDNPVVFINKAFLDLTGYEEHQVVGRNCRFLQGEQTDPESVAEVRKALEEHRGVALDLLNYKADGTPFWNALFIGPIFDERGELLYFFASQLDVTQRRVSEQSFRHAQKMEAIGQLTAGLAHDFNNLLQVITGNLEVAQQSVADNSALSMAIEHAQAAAERGGKLTQQLLAFARKQRLEPQRLNLNTLVVEFSEMAVRALGEHVDLRLDLKPGLPSCALDPTHMEMALLNVLMNARDAMPSGGRVTVGTATLQNPERSAAHNLPSGNYVVLCVIDEGEGMAPDVLRRASEPFFSTKGPGTGLGLAMVHGFVQQSHGRLEIESEVGKGTTVRMIFPVAGERASHPEEGPLGDPPPAVVGQQTILLVEDSSDVREVTLAHLVSLGYRVLAADSGEMAMQIVDESDGDIDLLFTDVIMPGGINGLVLAERARERIPGLPVLLTTGYADDLAGRGVDASALNILNKPYKQRELAEYLDALLGRRQPA